MDAIYSATAPGNRPREARAVARERLVRITGNGNGAYVFCSEDVSRREVDDAVERALHASWVEAAVARGKAAFKAGDFVEGTAAARRAVAERCAARG